MKNAWTRKVLTTKATKKAPPMITTHSTALRSPPSFLELRAAGSPGGSSSGRSGGAPSGRTALTGGRLPVGVADEDPCRGASGDAVGSLDGPPEPPEPQQQALQPRPLPRHQAHAQAPVALLLDVLHRV